MGIYQEITRALARSRPPIKKLRWLDWWILRARIATTLGNMDPEFDRDVFVEETNA